MNKQKKSYSDEHVIIFSDGASKGNPGPGGWGAVVVFNGHVIELGDRENHTTNNKMELMAAVDALNTLNALSVTENFSGQEILLHTDSRYVINGITKWISAWKKRDWKTLQKEDVLHRDLWQALDAAVSATQLKGGVLRWVHVPGHSGVWGNERVDQIASSFAEGIASRLFSGSLSKYGTDILNISFDSTKKEQKDSNKSRSRAQAYSYVSMVLGVIHIDHTWLECEKRVKRVPGALFKKTLNATEEKEIVRDFKNRA